MGTLRILTASEQVAQHLRDELRRGTWTGAMPGEDRLMAQLGVGRNTIKAALGLLEAEGVLIGKGAGHQRRIVPQQQTKSVMRIRILLYEKRDRSASDIVDLKHRLVQAGHRPDFTSKDLITLGMDPSKVARMVRQTPADAWVVRSAPRDVLQWFVQQTIPVFAFYGRHADLPITGVSARKIPALLKLVRHLVALGHRRIVMLAREDRRKPQPGLFEQAFLDELEKQGIQTGLYHLPDWENTKDGFHRCLDALFHHTPPTALIICEATLFVAAQQHLALMGIQAPEKISLICDDPDPSFEWCEPAISHFAWDPQPLVRSVVRWANQVARGKQPHTKTYSVAEFIEGGTTGPAAAQKT